MSEHYTSAAQYDVIIVGAGPAGLSAARSMARLGFSTVVAERMSAAGQLSHPCAAILQPMPGILKGRRLLGDLFYPELDLLIPLALVNGYPRLHRFVSPSGLEIEAPFARADSTPVAAVDKSGLLELLADQASSAGADMRWGVEVTGLIKDGEKVVGVHTPDGDLRASIVMSAEGASRRLSRQAGLYPYSGSSTRHATIVTEELEAPGVRRTNLGQITTFGRRYTSARAGFGTVVMPLPGRASVTFTLLAERPHHHTPSSANFYVDEYISQDPRVSSLLAGATVLQRSAFEIAIEDGPANVAADGFVSLGDAATPSGHLGILPAMYLGRKAALVAAEALDNDDFSAERLGMYGTLFHRRIQRVLQAEREVMLGLAELPDSEIDRFTRILAGLPLSSHVFGGWNGIPWEATRWLQKRFPAGSYRTSLVDRILAQDGEQHGGATMPLPGWWPASVQSPSHVS